MEASGQGTAAKRLTVAPFPMEARFGFAACVASLMTAHRPPFGGGTSDWWEAYQRVMVISGLAWGLVYTADPVEYADQDLHRAVPGDGYVAPGMAAAGLRYRIIERDEISEEDLRQIIVESLDNGWPVMAEGVFGESWSLIVNEKEDGEILQGYAPFRRTHHPRPYRPDGFEDDRLCYRSQWYESCKRMLVIDGFEEQPWERETLFRHWMTVMRGGKDGAIWRGMAAWRALLDDLQDKPWENMEMPLLEILYEPLSRMWCLPQSRGTLGALCHRRAEGRWLRDRLAIPAQSALDIEMDRIWYSCNTLQVWARQSMQVISDPMVFEPNIGIYADRVRDPDVRREAVRGLYYMYQQDLTILHILEKAVGEPLTEALPKPEW